MEEVFGALARIVLVLIVAVIGMIVYVEFANASPIRLDFIKKFDGLHERNNNSTLRKMLGVNPARTPWCGYAVGYIVKKTGGTPPKGYPRALSWKNFGKKVTLKTVRKGDVVVVRTKRGHHVTIFSRISGNKICGFGGNQSNRIKESCYSIKSIVAIRR